MNSKTTYFLLASTIAGLGYVGGLTSAGIDTAEAVPQEQQYNFEGTANATLQSNVESCVGSQVLSHANDALGLSGDNALGANDIQRVSFVWFMDKGQRKMRWRYWTKPIQGYWLPGEPQ